jgi:hypothetical protein
MQNQKAKKNRPRGSDGELGVIKKGGGRTITGAKSHDKNRKHQKNEQEQSIHLTKPQKTATN